MLEYVNRIEDLMTFTGHHLRTSPASRRALRLGTLAVGVGGLVLAFGISVIAGESPARATVMGVFVGAGAAVGWRLAVVRSTLAQTRRLYAEDRNKGTLGRHRLSLTDDALREESEAGSSETRFDAIERIVETPSHVLIYVDALHAHVIPRSEVAAGDLGAFLAALRSRSPGCEPRPSA
jgi:hypothetical protein